MKNNYFLFIALILLSFLFSSCASNGKLNFFQHKKLDKTIDRSAIFNTGYSGFLIMDAESGNVVYEKRSENYFTPASNVKILTLLAAIEVLNDSIPVFYYRKSGDQLRIFPVGSPSFNTPFLEEEVEVIEWLGSLSSEKEIILCKHPTKEGRFGPGWAWDGFNFNYQTEKSVFPLYGNRIEFTFFPFDPIPQIQPDIFAEKTTQKDYDLNRPGLISVQREERTNSFTFRSDGLNSDTIVRYVPFIPDDTTLVELFGNFASHQVSSDYCEFNRGENWSVVYAANPDSIYRRFMQASDNFIGEQLMMTISFELFDTIHTSRAIQYIVDSMWTDLPQKPYWWDGSGLSRYNLIPPVSIAHLLARIYHRDDTERISSYFPVGGESGTIRNWYAGEDNPFVFAKTGTLRNHHALSGYFTGSSGRTYIFSFMHNVFPGSPNLHRQEMERVLNWLYGKL